MGNKPKSILVGKKGIFVNTTIGAVANATDNEMHEMYSLILYSYSRTVVHYYDFCTLTIVHERDNFTRGNSHHNNAL